MFLFFVATFSYLVGSDRIGRQGRDTPPRVYTTPAATSILIVNGLATQHDPQTSKIRIREQNMVKRGRTHMVCGCYIRTLCPAVSRRLVGVQSVSRRCPVGVPSVSGRWPATVSAVTSTDTSSVDTMYLRPSVRWPPTRCGPLRRSDPAGIHSTHTQQYSSSQ